MPYDANKDGLLYVEAQAGVGNSASRVQAQLQLVNLSPLLRRNVALNTPGTVTINNWKADVATTGDPAVAEVAGGFYSTSGLLPASQWGDVLDTNVSGQTGSSTPSADTILSPDVLAILKDSATHKYTTPSVASWANSALEGITYIKTNGLSNLPNGTTNGAGTIALPKLPGILILEGGGGLTVGGNGDFYGLIYTDGPFTNNGGFVVHGMLIAKGDVVLKGDQTIMFDPGVLYALDRIVALHVRVVGGTWREIQPVYN